MRITVEVNCCKECPYLKQAKSYGTDGRDGCYYNYCSVGCFGKFDVWGYLEPNKEDINVINENCKFNK